MRIIYFFPKYFKYFKYFSNFSEVFKNFQNQLTDFIIKLIFLAKSFSISKSNNVPLLILG